MLSNFEKITANPCGENKFKFKKNALGWLPIASMCTLTANSTLSSTGT